jgi:predicted ABC-type ATPase
MPVKRLRIFAGPNGSGKSTLVKFITENFNIPFGYFINADEIEKELKETNKFNFAPFGLQVTEAVFGAFASKSSFNEKAADKLWESAPVISNNCLSIAPGSITSYHAALIADFVREALLETGISFTFETVLSDERKLAFLKKAKLLGYRVYLYYVATENPEINIARVRNRVLNGGHNVPTDKIWARYGRSIQLLPKIVHQTDRAFLFDNSTSLRFFAEISSGNKLETMEMPTPSWLGGLVQS